ncbi:MAG: Hpt domain-containing protein [Xanthomonadales bacterium]|nr:Hpt domain-containing protein [Xanthomonadales bacterium]
MTSLINSAQLDRFKDKPALVHRLIRIYLDMSPNMIAEIKSAASAGDIEQVGSKAHSLKGSSAELGAEQLADISHQLQMAARNGVEARIGPLIDELHDCHEKTVAALEELDPG